MHSLLIGLAELLASPVSVAKGIEEPLAKTALIGWPLNCRGAIVTSH